MDPQRHLRKKVDLQVRRMKKAEQDRPNLLAQSIYIGTLGLLFVLPLIGGVYLGHWLDSLIAGYSIKWTISLLLLGLFVGMINVYLFIKE